MSVRRVKKEYEVLEGEVNNEPAVTHSSVSQDTNSILYLPNKSNTTIETPLKERYKLIQEIMATGLSIGSKVIRVNHIATDLIDKPEYIGVVHKFLMRLQPGWTRYYPLLIRFTQKDGTEQTFPFQLHEIETIEKAREIVETERKKNLLSTQVIDIARHRSIVSADYSPIHPRHTGD